MRRRMRNEAINSSETTTGVWMTTFTDLVMLMVTFFVMLLAMSSMSGKSLKNIFGYYIKPLAAVESTGALARALEKAGHAPEKIAGLTGLKEDERGILLTLEESLLFEPGRAEIKNGSYRVLDAVAGVISSSSNDILIMSHTDDAVLDKGEYESNLELSAFRSLSVLDYFTKKRRLPESRFHVGGYGSYSPLFPNDTSKHRELNRRVEIIFKH